MRQGDARGPDTISGFTPEDIARGYRAQRAVDQRWLEQPTNGTVMEQVPVPIEVATLYELRGLRATMDAVLEELQALNQDRQSDYNERMAGGGR